MRPHGVPPGHAALTGESRPQVGGIADPAGSQLQTHQRGKQLLSRTVGGPTAPDDLGQRIRGVRHPPAHRGRGHFVHPSLDQRQQRLKPRQDLELEIGLGGGEQPALQLLAEFGEAFGSQGAEIADFDRRGDGADIDGDLASVVLQQGQHLRDEPADVGEQSLPGAFADRKIDAHIIVGDAQS